MRKKSRQKEALEITLCIVLKPLEQLNLPRTAHNLYREFADFDGVLHFLAVQKDRINYYSGVVLLRGEESCYAQNEMKDLPAFKERIYTYYWAEALEDFAKSITAGTEYPVFVEKKTNSLQAFKYVLGNDGSIVPLSNFKHKEWVDENSEDFKAFLSELIEQRMQSTELRVTSSSLRELLKFDDDEQI